DRRGFHRSEFLATKGNGRKLQLFLCACCRRALDRLPQEQRLRTVQMAYYFLPDMDLDPVKSWDICRHAVEVAERFADGRATEAERQDAARAAHTVDGHFVRVAAFGWGQVHPQYDAAAVRLGRDAVAAAASAAFANPLAAEQAVRLAVTSAAGAGGRWGEPEAQSLLARRAELAAQWRLLVDIFGEGPLPVLDPAWRTRGLVALAAAIYEERRSADTPVLADALEEAGCNN